MRLWETYFRLWKKFGDSLIEETTQSQFKEKCHQDNDCITNYFGSVYDKCSTVNEEGICFESGV
jgi:hypothetical protein